MLQVEHEMFLMQVTLRGLHTRQWITFSLILWPPHKKNLQPIRTIIWGSMVIRHRLVETQKLVKMKRTTWYWKLIGIWMVCCLLRSPARRPMSHSTALMWTGYHCSLFPGMMITSSNSLVRNSVLRRRAESFLIMLPVCTTKKVIWSLIAEWISTPI